MSTLDVQDRYARWDDRHSAHWVLRALRAGETVEVQGIPVKMTGGGVDVQPGDLYVGARNTANLLTAKSVGQHGCVWPEESAYPFYVTECIKVDAVL
jgi:hypothetical protein